MSESGPHNLPDDALVDLLVKQVTEGLSPAEQRELDVLDSAAASDYLRDFERAAAAISLAGTTWVPPPAALIASLEQRAERHFAAEGDARAVAASAPPAATAEVTDLTAARMRAAERAPPAGRRGVTGWLAAAACLVLAVVGWLRTPPAAAPPELVQTAPVVAPPPQPPAPPPLVPPTPAEARLALLANTDAVKVTLGPTKDPAAAGVTGDVVWDPATQIGYLHFVGLATNDPRMRQYQIWIFDGKRDKRYPVDGGVFDVPADTNEVVIPIHAALPISLAKAFAVTVEKPGGVVVSALGHVVALGAVG